MHSRHNKLKREMGPFGKMILKRERAPPKQSSVQTHKLVCIEKRWMENTKFLRYLRLFDACFKIIPDLWTTCLLSTQDIIQCLSVHCGGCGASDVLHRLWDVGDGRHKNRHNLGLAFLLLLKYESKDGCFALIERVKDRVYRCDSAQKQAYTMVIQHGAHAFECYDSKRKVFATKWDSLIPTIDQVKTNTLEDSNIPTGTDIPFVPKQTAIKSTVAFNSYLLPASNETTPLTKNNDMSNKPCLANILPNSLGQVVPSPNTRFAVLASAEEVISSELYGDTQSNCRNALRKIHFMVEDYLDTHKENAFNSSLHEPARFYFDLCRNYLYRDHVNVHGINGFLCLIRGWFGCQIPIIPLTDDYDTFKGCADIWAGLSNDAWSVFSEPSNFGKDFEGLKGLNRKMLKDDRHGEYDPGCSFVGRTAKDMEESAKKKDKRYLPYANKFAFFFTKEFLVKRMFEVLNAEVNPAYIGFRKACDNLYPVFQKQFILDEYSLLEFLYDDDMMYLDINKATFFFWWCGICKQSSVEEIFQFAQRSQTKLDQETRNTCPICFEEKEDIQQIPHWESHGDVSEHKMCSDCTKAYNKNLCPFCQEVSLKEDILACIEDFVQQVKAKSSNGDPNELAALLERWQFFEMEYGDNPRVIYRVAMLVLRDPEFMGMLRSGVQSKMPWMRDAAGIIFRLYSLSMEGKLVVTCDEQSLLNDCYRTIMDLAVASEIQTEGHFHGALYTQAMVPYICALQAGQSTQQLEMIVKEVGNLITSHYENNKHFQPDLRTTIPERIIEQYMSIVTANIWGGEENDPVWRTFYSNN